MAPDEADPPFDRRCHRVLTPPISRCGGAKGDARAQASPITPPRKGRGDPQPFPSCYIVFPKNTNRAKGSPLTFPGTRPWPSPSESRSAERRPCRPNPPAATPRAMRRPIDSFGFSSDLRSSPRRIPRDGSHASSQANSTALMASRGRLFRFFPSPRRRSRLAGPRRELPPPNSRRRKPRRKFSWLQSLENTRNEVGIGQLLPAARGWGRPGRARVMTRKYAAEVAEKGP